MADQQWISIGFGAQEIGLLSKYANRHGLVAGATGTGKTVTLQTLAEGLSRQGVPVFMADVKGDIAGISQPGGGNEKIDARAKQLGLVMSYRNYPVTFWDLFGKDGSPIRTTVSDMGPLLLARLLQLNDIQEGVLNVAFKLADDEGLLLLDLKDLRAMLNNVADRAEELRNLYGNVSSTTVGAIQRSILVLEEQGGENLFGEPALVLNDFMQIAPDGRGMINILAASTLMQNPRLYATFLLWLVSELFEDMPEVGDLAKPKLVFFFDEAHLLFTDAPKPLLEKIEQVVRLIRSKGIGIFFITQHPLDIPDSVLSQLSNRVQHALRAFTPRDQKAVETAAETFRVNPAFDTKEVITQLQVGEALVSVLGPDGAPTVVDRVFVRPPESHIGAIEQSVRLQIMNSSVMHGKYDQVIDRVSAYEMLTQRAAQMQPEAPPAEEQAQSAPGGATVHRPQTRYQEREQQSGGATIRKPASRRTDSVAESMVKSTLRSAGSQLGRSLVRGLLGSLFRR